MENAGISVEASPPDQLDQALQLDFESNAEVEAFEAEGLDFGLDGPYEEAEHVSTEEIPVDSYAGFDHDLAGHLPDSAVAEPELDQVDLEAHPAVPDDTIAQATEATNNADDDAEADVEYHDEIGYEDDDLLTAEANDELSTTEPDGAERALADTSSEDHPAPVPVTDLEELSHGNDASWDQDIDLEDHGESTEPHDPQHALDGADEEGTARQEEANSPTVGGFDDEATHEQFAPDHRAVDLDKELDDLTRSLAEVPDIEVLYNQECYSLFGTSDDDPDSYFLSGVEKLDCPLSEFLSALRTVISDDITTTDELVIRFDPLDLEFGERSSEKFLSRSFREILDCHTTLGQVPGVSADPVLHLTVRRDSEEHFLELLANVAQVEGSSNSDEDSEMLENHEEGSRPDDLYDEQVQDETFENGNLDEHHDESGHAVADHEENAELEIPLGHDDVSGEQDDGVSGEQGDDVSGEQDQDNQYHATEPQPSETAEGEEHFDTPPAEELSHDIAEDRADEEQAWDEQVAEDDNETVPQYPEITLEETDEPNHQPAEQQGDEIPEISNPSAVDGVVAPNDGASEHEAGSNDDDLILAFDDEPSLSSIHEGEDEHGEDAITFDDLEIPNNDAEDVQESVTAETLNESVVGHSENRGHDTAVAETASIHTSTTINGDEIDYDEDNTAHSTSTPANDDAHDDAQQLAAVSGEDKDEIDWENDEDEYEQQPATENAGVDYEESKEIPLTSPSVAGKRSRADETESLADETDYKRRRT